MPSSKANTCLCSIYSTQPNLFVRAMRILLCQKLLKYVDFIDFLLPHFTDISSTLYITFHYQINQADSQPVSCCLFGSETT